MGATGTTDATSTTGVIETEALTRRFGAVAAVGRPADLQARLGGDGVTLEDVFVHYAGDAADTEGAFVETARTRRTAQRLG